MGPFSPQVKSSQKVEKAEETKVQMAKKAPAAVQKNLIRNLIASR